MNTKTKQAHTPTPWTCEDLHNICIINGKQPFETQMANARYIVRCVNSHEELLEVCKALVRIAEQCKTKVENPEPIIRRIDQAQKAIANTEKE